MLRATVAVVLMMLSAGAAIAQVSDNLRSANLTVAQQQERDRRLANLSDQIAAIARQTALREEAVRNLAIELYGAQPDLSFEAYFSRIDSGARELQRYLAGARSQRAIDARTQEIRELAIGAAEAGRITEARALYQQLLDGAQARRAARDDEQRDDILAAIDAARLASAQADYDATLTYIALANDIFGPGLSQGAPAQNSLLRDTLEMMRLLALVMRAHAQEHSQDVITIASEIRGSSLLSSPRRLAALGADAAPFYSVGVAALLAAGQAGDRESFRQAERLIETGLRASADPVTQGTLHAMRGYLAQGRRDDRVAERSLQTALTMLNEENAPTAWAQAQSALGAMYLRFADNGDVTALERARPLLENALRVREELGGDGARARALMAMGQYHFERGDAGTRAAYAEAVPFLQRATDEMPADDDGIAGVRGQLGLALAQVAIDDLSTAPAAISALRAALETYRREEGPRFWAAMQLSLGNSLALGNNVERYHEAAQAFEAALPTFAGRDDLRFRLEAQFKLAYIYAELGRRGEVQYLGRAVELLTEAIADAPSAARPPIQLLLAGVHIIRNQHGLTTDKSEARAAADAALASARRTGNAYMETAATLFLAQQFQQ